MLVLALFRKLPNDEYCLKSMKIFIIFTFVSSHVFYATGQSISSFTVNSTGKTLTSTQIALTFTLGELATGKYSSSQRGGYQGFIIPHDLFVTSIILRTTFESL